MEVWKNKFLNVYVNSVPPNVPIKLKVGTSGLPKQMAFTYTTPKYLQTSTFIWIAE